MSKIRIKSLAIKNYRSFGEKVEFEFPDENYRKPITIIGYNNTGKTNLLSAIKFGLFESVREETFEIADFHDCNYNNPPCFALKFSCDFHDNKLLPNHDYTNISIVHSSDNKIESVEDYCNCYGDSKLYSKKWSIKQNAPIYYVNFHNIKDEISTQKTSWGTLKSFLGKHIDKLVKTDVNMLEKKNEFQTTIKNITTDILEGSSLKSFVSNIKKNYENNLRDNNCFIDFGLPHYEDIFLKMIFKIGLNGKEDKPVPINHFGDGYISMFVMAVIQAIAETNTEDECLFLFEEPESFLHENHQEYFYKTVLCGLAEKGHQVIYTTHSDKMIDPFDTKGLIRLEQDEKNQTVCKYNETEDFTPEQIDEDTGEIINMSRYNEFIKTIEPNLNRILFSKKVILVEGPNDVLVYKTAIKKKVLDLVQDKAEIINKERYAETYLNFHNISIICHHGKGTALYLIKLCEWFNLDYYVINDWDFELNEISIEDVQSFDSVEALKESDLYEGASNKSMVTINWNLLEAAKENQIHFNVKKLETVIGYGSNDKNSLSIWKKRLSTDDFAFDAQLFPESLEKFLELKESDTDEIIEEEQEENLK